MTLKSVLSGLDIRYKTSDGKKVPVVNGVASLADASRHDLSFCSSNGEYGAYLTSKSNAGVILCKKSVQDFISVYGYNPHKTAKANHIKQHLILVDNPRLRQKDICKSYQTFIFMKAICRLLLSSSGCQCCIVLAVRTCIGA